MTMPVAKTIDIDALIASKVEESRSKRKYVKVSLFGREWRISDQTNNFLLLRAGEGDVNAFTQFLLNCPHADDQREFRDALLAFDAMEPEILLDIINAIMEAVAGNPTKSSSASSPSVRTRVAKPKSVAT